MNRHVGICAVIHTDLVGAGAMLLHSDLGIESPRGPRHPLSTGRDIGDVIHSLRGVPLTVGPPW
ncbi:MAG: hypothetical protein U0904_11985, partial [Candidatus Nanopelagicales bacterium]|nr:hypothetical protein [Candidatus Nanopelagicales bacterium]